MASLLPLLNVICTWVAICRNGCSYYSTSTIMVFVVVVALVALVAVGGQTKEPQDHD